MNTKQIERINRLMPDGKPRYVRCYDNGGLDTKHGTFDRYTVVFTGKYMSIGIPKGIRQPYGYEYLGMSEHPFHPQGFGQHGEDTKPIDRPSYSHLGKKISFDQLPEDCKLAVLQDYKENWNIEC